MSPQPSSASIQRWYPKQWSEIVGNARMTDTWKGFIKNGPCNAMFTGPSRSGKTRTITLGIRALLCTNRTPDLDPCLRCSTCRALGEGRSEHSGVFAALAGSEYSFHTIDCETITAEELAVLRYDDHLEREKTLVYLDEVGALCSRRLEGKLLKMIDESPAVWIASAVRLGRTKGTRKGEWKEGLSEAMKGRFPIKVGTSHPHLSDLHSWIVARSAEWNITILNAEQTIPEMMKRTRQRVGYLIHMFAEAATRCDRTIDLARVDRFNLDSVD